MGHLTGYTLLKKFHQPWLEDLYESFLLSVNDVRYSHIRISWNEPIFLADYEILETLGA